MLTQDGILFILKFSKKIHNYEQEFIINTSTIDTKALALFKENPESAINYLTDYSTRLGDKVTDDWRHFYRYLFMKYMDGNKKNSY